jgi:2-oxoglutarate dehydrogenase E2 component (dihydrolipoamide succinyltransferase)
MRIEVKVPQLPESVTEATLVNWHKKAGEPVKRDENLIDVETDKVVLELPAPGDGVLVEITRPDGSTVTSNDVIAVIDTDAKGAPAAPASAPAPAPAAARPAQPPPPVANAKDAKTADGPIAMPAARKMMADQGVDPATVEGSGRGGRITKGDVIGAVDGKAAPAPAAAPATPAAPAAKPATAPPVALRASLGSRPEQRVPMSRLRLRVAERLVQSQSTAAILTTFNEVNMQPVIELRNRYKERFEKEHGVKLGFMGFFVKAAVHALKKFPALNASIDGSDIVYHGYFDVGIAVGSPPGWSCRSCATPIRCRSPTSANR